MAQSSKQTRIDRLRGVGIEGSMSRSQSGSENVRERRAAQREGSFSQRFDPDVFTLDASGRVTLKDSALAATTAMQTFAWRPGETSPSGYFDLGYVVGPKMDAVSDEIFGYWVIPPDCNRKKPITLHTYLAQSGTNAGSFENDVEVYAYAPTANVVTDDGTPEVTLELNGTATTTDGDPHVFESELLSTDVFALMEAEALVFKAVSVAVAHANTDLVWHMGAISYTRTLFSTPS